MLPVIAAALIGGGAGVIGNIFGWLWGKNRANAEKAYNNLVAQLHNEWLSTRKGEVKQLLDQLVARGQDIYGPQVTTQEGTSSSRTVEDIDQLESPEITPEYAPLAGLQRGLLERRLSSPTGLPPGYAETGVSAMNQGAEGALNDIRNLARERGVSEDTMMIGSPAERSRRQQIASFTSELPLKARELQNQDLGLAQDALTAFGRAMRRKGRNVSSTTGSTSGTVTSPVDYGAIADLLLTPGPKAAIMR